MDMRFDLPGIEITNEDGSVLMIETCYPESYLHGRCSLGDAVNIRPDCLRRLNGNLRLTRRHFPRHKQTAFS
jgi:hypothetical protein